MNPQAEELNKIIQANSQTAFELLSDRGGEYVNVILEREGCNDLEPLDFPEAVHQHDQHRDREEEAQPENHRRNPQTHFDLPAPGQTRNLVSNRSSHSPSSMVEISPTLDCQTTRASPCPQQNGPKGQFPESACLPVRGHGTRVATT